MREFLLSVIAVVVLSIIFEVVFPAKRMKGALSLVFSLAMIFILSNGIKSIFTKDNLTFLNPSIELENNELLTSTVVETEKQLKQALTKKGYNVRDVELCYVIDELSVTFSRADIKVDGEVDQEKLKEDVSEIIDIKKENIWVQN